MPKRQQLFFVAIRGVEVSRHAVECKNVVKSHDAEQLVDVGATDDWQGLNKMNATTIRPSSAPISTIGKEADQTKQGERNECADGADNHGQRRNHQYTWGGGEIAEGPP